MRLNRMTKTMVPVVTALGLVACSQVAPVDVEFANVEPTEKRLPNIVIFYADDLGYGDLADYGAKGIPTPNIDKLIDQGVRFTDAHAAAATCTPSRYALLTGEYGFRSKAAILPGDAPLLIRPDKETIADMLHSRGYATAVVGKWHLGLGDGAVDWNQAIKPGPAEIGFDYSFLIPATGDRVPTVYVENQRVAGLDSSDTLKVSYGAPIGSRPVGRENPQMLRQQADDQHSDTIINGISRIGYMEGGQSAEWVDEEFHTVFPGKAIEFMRQNKDRPFFLFFPFHDPHVPRLPAKEFQGATTMGPRGDAIVQLDFMLGQVMAEIERLGLGQDTLVIFSSDNGPVLNDGYEDGAVELLGDHKPAGPFSGGKYSAYEAGTRVPTIAWWPGTIEPGVSSALMSQVDLFASLAGLTGATLPDTVAIDSQDLSDAWLGRTQQGRRYLLKEWMVGYTMRDGQLKYIEPLQDNTQKLTFENKGIESGSAPYAQLFDLSRDVAETTNLATQRPADTARIAAELKRVKAQTRADRGR